MIDNVDRGAINYRDILFVKILELVGLKQNMLFHFSLCHEKYLCPFHVPRKFDKGCIRESILHQGFNFPKLTFKMQAHKFGQSSLKPLGAKFFFFNFTSQEWETALILQFPTSILVMGSLTFSFIWSLMGQIMKLVMGSVNSKVTVTPPPTYQI